MKIEPIVSSEASAIRTQTPGNYPKRNKLHLEHGESLKTRTARKCLQRVTGGGLWDKLKIIRNLLLLNRLKKQKTVYIKKVNPEIVRRVFWKNCFHGRVARNKTFISQRCQKARMQFADSHLRKGSEFWKTVVDNGKYNASGLDGRNYVWRMAGGRTWVRKASSSGQTCWWHRDGVRTHGSVRSGTSSFYGRRHEQTRWCQHSLSTSDSQCWKTGVQESFAFHHEN